MIDMHMHTTYSDGDKSLEEVLIKCEYKKLEYISITDHNTCKAYDDKNIRNNKINSYDESIRQRETKNIKIKNN